MKLSEAIRMNGMMRPQGFGGDSIACADAPCALGGALQSIGMPAKQTDGAFALVTAAWPWSAEREACCPVCSRGESFIRNIIWHLNDQHRWSRFQIADWVETVEPVTLETEETVSELVAK